MASLYRQKALKTLSSPEQLDRMIVITPPLVWLAIAAGFVLTVVVCVWAFLGSIYSTTTCSALYFDRGELNYTYSPVSGFVRKCNIRLDEWFQAGDVLFEIEDDAGEITTVTAPTAGCADSWAHEGYYAAKGTELQRYWQENAQDTGYVYCLVPFSKAASIQKGARVMLYPSHLDDQEFGHMTGTVERVGKDPINKAKLYYQIGNQVLINTILEQGPTVAVYCVPDPDPESENGFHWTNRNGRSVLLTNEMPITAEIVISRESPLSLLSD